MSEPEIILYDPNPPSGLEAALANAQSSSIVVAAKLATLVAEVTRLEAANARLRAAIRDSERAKNLHRDAERQLEISLREARKMIAELGHELSLVTSVKDEFGRKLRHHGIPL